MEHHGGVKKKSHGFQQREATTGYRSTSFPLLVSEIIERLFMIKMCVTLNEGQGQYN